MFVKELKLIYKKGDQFTRRCLGEVELKPYMVTSEQVGGKEELRRKVYADFLDEQPSYLQFNLLKVYVSLRHAVAITLKRIRKK